MATTASENDRIELTELPVETDPNISINEREFNCTVTGREDEMHIFAGLKTVVKSLLNHDLFEPYQVRIAVGDGCRTIAFNDQIPDSATAIYSVWGTMPVGCLTVKSVTRSQNNVSSVVNSETVDPSVFE
jgi:hypothetical protein